MTTLRNLLLSRQRELRQRLEEIRAERLSPSTVDLHDVSDRKDEAARSESDDVEEARQALLRKQLDDVEAALLRVGLDGFGLCVDCGEPVGASRLLAQPSTLRCLSCQASYEVLVETRA